MQTRSELFKRKVFLSTSKSFSSSEDDSFCYGLSSSSSSSSDMSFISSSKSEFSCGHLNKSSLEPVQRFNALSWLPHTEFWLLSSAEALQPPEVHTRDNNVTFESNWVKVSLWENLLLCLVYITDWTETFLRLWESDFCSVWLFCHFDLKTTEGLTIVL